MTSLVLWVTPIPAAAARPRTELLEDIEPEASIEVVLPTTTDSLIGLVKARNADAIVVYSAPNVDARVLAENVNARVYRPVREPYLDRQHCRRERTTGLARVA